MEFQSNEDYGAHMALQTCWKASDARKKREGLAEQVKEVERRAADWEKLAREIMATIRVNRLRGTITSADEKHFDQICEGWYRWMMRIVTGSEEPLQYGGIYFCQICGEAHKNGEACPHSSETNVV